ncbi:cation transporting ATPase C-terminal domain-containing protein, partial [Sphingomonas fennica]
RSDQTTDPTGHHSRRSTGHRSCRRALDGADSEDLAKPHAWDMAAIMRFTAIMGPLSSIFDIATFALLIGVVHAGIGEFRAAWFIESMASQILVVFVIRTSLPFWRSKPHRALTASALLGLASAVVLPFGPWAGLLGFTSPSIGLVAGIAALILIYLAAAELLKGYALRAAPAKALSARLTRMPV